jgi:transcriptional regulator with XRE-family HTH domain
MGVLWERLNAQQKRDLVEQIRVAIQSSDLSAYELAKRSGVDKASLSRFIAGERSLSLESIEKLAPVLDLKIVVTSRRRKRD